MPCDQTIGAPVTLSVSCSSGLWQNSGLSVNVGECLQITTPGTTVKFGVNPSQCSYPEGFYSSAGNPCAVITYDPTAVDATFGGEPGNAYLTLLQPAYSLVAAIGAQPSGTHLSGLLRPNRNTVFPAATVGAGGTVWLNFNDNIFSDNTGSFTVTLQRLFTTPPYAVFTLGGSTGAGSGTRFSPMSEQVYQSLGVTFPNGYAVGVELSAVPGLFHTTFTSVRCRGPYRAYLAGSILHVVNDSGELASGAALDGVDFLRIGT